MIAAMWRDVRYGVRMLARHPGFTMIAIVSLALGIGLNTAIFSIVNAVLLRPLAVDRPEELVAVYTSADSGDAYSSSSYPDYADLAANSSTLDGLTAHTLMFVGIDRGDVTKTTLGEIVSPNYFELLGVHLAAGRGFQPGDERVTAPPTAVISSRMWQRDFGRDPNVIGRTLQIRGRAYAIVGVAPDTFGGLAPGMSAELWLPAGCVDDVEPVGMIDVTASPTGTNRIERRGQRWLFLTGRLKPGVTTAQARANLTRVMTDLEQANPQTNKHRTLTVVPASSVRIHPELDASLTPGAAALDDCGGARVARRVRQSREPAARAGHGAIARDGHPPRDRREPRAARPPAHDREPRARGGRRAGRAGARHVGDARARGDSAAGRDRPVVRLRPGRPRVDLHAGDRDAHRSAVRPRARAARVETQPRAVAQGRGPGRRAAPLRSAPVARGLRDRAVDGAARDRRPAPAEHVGGRARRYRRRRRPRRLCVRQRAEDLLGSQPRSAVLPGRGSAPGDDSRRHDGRARQLDAVVAQPQHERHRDRRRARARAGRRDRHRYDGRQRRLFPRDWRAGADGPGVRQPRHEHKRARRDRQCRRGAEVLARPERGRTAVPQPERRDVYRRRCLGRLRGTCGRRSAASARPLRDRSDAAGVPELRRGDRAAGAADWSRRSGRRSSRSSRARRSSSFSRCRAS